ncbi:MAG: S-layer homology domain-containing protein, partial [Clostridiales bacterium]|nr:S-layer homology domain-containing protein [Clostridiales bacterium]
MMLSAENVDGINSKYAKIYRCKVCGEVVTTLPANCPICGRPGSTFEVYELFTVEAIAGVNGSITPSGIVYIPKGMSQSFIFTPDAVHEIDQIFIDDELYNDDSVKDLGDYDSKTCTYTFIDVESSHTIEATFKRITYTIEVSVGSNGSIDPSDDVTVPHGDDQTFAFLPISGYGVDQILIDGKAYIDESVKDLGEYDSETCTYTFISVEVNHTIHVTFKRIFYIVTATANEGGSIEPEGEVEVALDEDSPKIEFKAAPGFVIDKLIINGEDENIFSGYAGGWIIFESADFEEDGDITLEVVFKPSLDFNITTATGANGHMLYVDIDGEYEDPLDAFTDLDPNDTINVEQGRVAAFMIVPDAGYTINQISIDDKLYSSPDNKDTGEVLIEDGYTWYIFYGVQSDHAISVTFKSTGSSSGGGGSGTASYTVTFNSNGGSAVTSSTVAANTKVAKPADPSKEGFIFDGWFTASDLNAAYNFDTPVTKSFTLYAKWIEDEEKGEGDDFPFTDVLKSAWYYDYIKSVYELGLMNGTGDTLFSPAMPVTRGMLVTVLHRMEDTPEAEEPASFSDVAADTWYTDAVAWAEAEGIVEGYPDGTFKPNQNVSRQELATVLLRYAKFIGKDQSSAGPDDPVRDDEDDESEADEEEIEAVTAIISDDLDFADAAKIADWAKEGVAFCAKNGIIEGRTGKIFDPAAFATRAEFATMLHRFIENVVN